MEVFYIVLVLLILSRLGGELAERFGQPALAGELIAGVALGILINYQHDWFPVLSSVREYEGFQVLADFGMFFLMLLGGLELKPSKLLENPGRASLIAVGGLLVPLAAGFGATWAFLEPSDVRPVQALFVGVALAITAVPVSVKVLMDLGKLESPVGSTIVAAALVDDILSLLLLAVLTGLLETGGLPSGTELGLIIGGALLFIAITFAIARWVLPFLYSRVFGRAKVDEFELSGLLIVSLAFALLAELLGLHFILGPFVAGLFFGQRGPSEELVEKIESKVSGITSGFLAPLFFVSIGLHTDISAIAATPVFFLIILAVAFGAKIFGTAAPARTLGFDNRQSVAIGVGMSGRGAVELIIADIALRAGLFEKPTPVPDVVQNMFGIIVLVAVITTVATPLLLRKVLSKSDT